MSYILDALKRAEEERADERAGAGTSGPRREPRRSRPVWAWALIGVLLLNAAAVVFVVMGGRLGWPPDRSRVEPDRSRVDRIAPAAPPAPAAPLAAQESPSPPAPPAETRAVEPTAIAPPAPPAPSAAVRERRREARQPESPPVAAKRASPAGEKPERQTADGARDRAAPPPIASPVARPTTDPVPAPGPSARSAAPERVERKAAEPADAAATALLREAVAKLKLQALVYSPKAEERMVFVDGRKYVEGQTIEDRFLVEKIREEGVVLSYQGQQALLKQ